MIKPKKPKPFLFKPIKLNSKPMFQMKPLVKPKPLKRLAQPKPLKRLARPKPMFRLAKAPTPIKKNMNWKQAKKAYPKLKPRGDHDRDGVLNKFDCKPFDRMRQGPAHEARALDGMQKEIKEDDLDMGDIMNRVADMGEYDEEAKQLSDSMNESYEKGEDWSKGDVAIYLEDR